MKTQNKIKPKVIRRVWSAEEIEIITNLFADNYTADVCAILNRSYGSVTNQANLLNLRKSDNFKTAELQKQAERLKVVGARFKFKKGRQPSNKGIKVSKEVYAQMEATMFKKGSVPANTKFDGYERISKDGYIEVRIRKGKFVRKHRLLYEKHHGKIEPGFIIVFKDGNKKNLAIENLKKISKKENIERNSIHRLPDELKSVIKILNKLKTKINEKQD